MTSVGLAVRGRDSFLYLSTIKWDSFVLKFVVIEGTQKQQQITLDKISGNFLSVTT